MQPNKMNARRASWTGLAACVALAASALVTQAGAAPILELVKLPGPGVTIAVRLRNITATPVAGWQAFVEFDQSVLTFVGGAYVTTNFGLPVINPITAVGNQINVACGVDPTLAQPPSNVNQDVAYLIFNPVTGGCRPQVRIRPNIPPTRLTNINGFDIVPLTTSSPWVYCPADIDNSGFLGPQDIFDFLAFWFAGDCRADFNLSGAVSVQDIFDFLAAWFAGCP